MDEIPKEEIYSESYSELKRAKHKAIVFGILGIIIGCALGMFYYSSSILLLSNNTAIINQTNPNDQSYQSGYESGVSDVLNYITLVSSNCNPIPINASGRTVTLVSIDCLKK